MQILFSVQGDTLVIPLQSNFEVHTTRNGVVWLGRLIPLKYLGLVILTREEVPFRTGAAEEGDQRSSWNNVGTRVGCYNELR